MKNKNITTAAAISIAPFILLALLNILRSLAPISALFKDAGKETFIFVFYGLILCQAISLFFIYKSWKSNEKGGYLLLFCNVLVILFSMWLIGFANVQG